MNSTLNGQKPMLMICGPFSESYCHELTFIMEEPKVMDEKFFCINYSKARGKC